jgi:UDP-2,4-diacetamido-2,4,6-trideoxy-beta-L-altropyranose hydrolase
LTAEQGTVVIRADGGLQIGTGHMMRCLALAQAWREKGGRTLFLSSDLPNGIKARLTAEGLPVERLEAEPGSAADANALIALADREEASWIVLDGYHLLGDYQVGIRKSVSRLLVLDDYGSAPEYVADLVLNQNISATPSWYQTRLPRTRLLLGPRFAILRQEFLPLARYRREHEIAGRRVLVTLGGSDPYNVSLTVLRGLAQLGIPDLDVVAIVGSANPHRRELEAVAGAMPKFEIRVDVGDMPKLMSWADVAVSGGGSTCWELCFMGLPFATVVLAGNQKAIAERLAAEGIGRNLGWHEDLTAQAVSNTVGTLLADQAARVEMAAKGRALVDGAGASRVVAAMREFES